MLSNEIDIEIMPDGNVLINRQMNQDLNSLLDLITMLNGDPVTMEQVKLFLDGREYIDVICMNEIFCG